jgi:uncharacterized protein YacL
MFFQDISKFSHTSDYVPLFIGAIITDIIGLLLINQKYFTAKSLVSWYKTFRLSAVLADVFSIVIGIAIARYIYSYVFSQFSILSFCLVVVAVQCVHDILFSFIIQAIPKGNSEMIDLFKDYAKELGLLILGGDAIMMISATLIASLVGSLDYNTAVFILLLVSYLVPYFLYSI